jgi:hypothetical protein
VEASARRAAPAGTVSGILGTDAYGREILHRRLGTFSCHPGRGVMVAMIDCVAEWLFDAERFWRVTTSHLQWASGFRPVAGEVLNDPAWRTDWERHSVDAVGAAHRLAVLLAMAGPKEDRIHALLGYAHHLQEGICKFLIASSQRLENQSISIDAIQANGLFNLTEWMRSRVGDLADPFDTPSRAAFAHNDFRVDQDRVVLCPLKPPKGGPVTLSFEQLEDHALHVVEASLGMTVTFLALSHAFGIELPEPDFLNRLGWEFYVTGPLSAAGWMDVELSIDHKQVMISASLNRSVRMAEFLMSLAFVPAAFDVIVFAVSRKQGDLTVTVPTKALRVYEASSEDMREVEFILLLSKMQMNGSSLADRDTFRKVISLTALSSASDAKQNVAGVQTRLGRLKAISGALSDEELRIEIGRVQTFVTYRMGGMESVAPDFPKLAKWGAAMVGPFRDEL